MAAKKKRQQYMSFQSQTEPGTIDPQLLAADIVASVDDIAEWSPQRLEGVALSRFTEEQLKIPMDERSLPNVIYDALWRLVKELYKRRNALAARSDYWSAPKRLGVDMIARVGLLSIYLASVDDILSVYQCTGPDAGLWVPVDEHLLVCISRAVCGSDLRSSDLKAFMLMLEADTELVNPLKSCRNRDLIPLANGIFDYRTKLMRPYGDPYTDVFTAKLAGVTFPYDPTTGVVQEVPDPDVALPQGVVLTVREYLENLASQAEGNFTPDDMLAGLITAVSCACRNRVVWKKAFILYGRGNDGKSTFVELLQGLYGPNDSDSRTRAICSVDPQDMSKPETAAALVGRLMNVVDDMDAELLLKKLGGFKSAVTHNRLSIRRLYHDAGDTYVPHATHWINTNSVLKTKDKSAGLYRRYHVMYFPGFKEKRPPLDDVDTVFAADPRVIARLAYLALVAQPKFWSVKDAPGNRWIDSGTTMFVHESDPMAMAWDVVWDEYLAPYRGSYPGVSKTAPLFTVLPQDVLYALMDVAANSSDTAHRLMSPRTPGFEEALARVFGDTGWARDENLSNRVVRISGIINGYNQVNEVLRECFHELASRISGVTISDVSKVDPVHVWSYSVDTSFRSKSMSVVLAFLNDQMAGKQRKAWYSWTDPNKPTQPTQQQP